MKFIELTQGQRAIVDDEDFEELNKYKWQAIKYRNGFYAVRMFTVSLNKRKMTYMHRFILKILELKNVEVDHKDMNGLNNTKQNLRLSNSFQNQYNVGLQKRNKSGFKGVSWNKIRAAWVVHINSNGKRIFGGYFNCLIKAANKYEEMALQYHKEFSKVILKKVA